MADRSVTATLRANVSGYIASMQSAGAATKTALNEHIVGVGKSKAAYQQLGVVTGAVTIGLAAGIGVAVAKFAKFDQAMSYVASSGADAANNIMGLRDAAIEAGASTVYTATQSANAVENLSKAGVSAADILGGALAGSLDLAAAGSFDVAEAASIAAGALTQFDLKGSDATHVADLLASGATKAQGDVRDLGLALQYVGKPLSSLGVSLEQTTGTLALFADNMIIGERAGTTMRSMIASLTAPSTIARAKMEELGISVFDSAGKFVGLDGVAGELNRTLGDATDAERSLALGVIFGNEALQGANVLVDAGAEGVRRWTAEVNDGTTAASIASVRLDNLAGDFEKLKGAIDSALIQTGSGGNDALRFMTQTATGLADVIGHLPPGMLAAGLAAGVLAVAVGLAGTAYFLAAPKVLAFKKAVEVTAATSTAAATYTKMGTAVMMLGRAIVPVGLALTVGAAIVGLYAKAHADGQKRVEDFAATLDVETGAVTASTKAYVLKKLADDGVLESAQKLGISSAMLTRAYLGDADAIEIVSEAAIRAANNNRNLFNAAHDVTGAIEEGKKTREDWANDYDIIARRAREAADAARFGLVENEDAAGKVRNAIEGVGAEFGNTADASDDAADTQVDNAGDVQAALEAEKQEVEDLITAYDTLRGITLGVGDAQAKYEQSLDDTTTGIADMIEEFGGLGSALDGTADVFNETTQEGRDLRDLFRGTADDAVALGEALHDKVLKETNDVPAANKAMQDSLAASRESMSLTLQSIGVGKDAADALALAYIAVPDLITTQIEADNAEELRKTEETKARLAALEVARTARILADVEGAMSGIDEINRAADYAARARWIYYYSATIDDDGEGGHGGKADGGRVGGWSRHDRADDILTRLTAGEVVIGNAARRSLDSRYGRGFLDNLVNGRVTGMGAQRAGYGGGTRIVTVGGDGASSGTDVAAAIERAIARMPRGGDLNVTQINPLAEPTSKGVERAAAMHRRLGP